VNYLAILGSLCFRVAQTRIYISNVLFRQTVLRIWDCLFLEGSAILLRVAVNIILKYSDAILRCRSTSDILEVFRDIPNSPLVLRCHEFLQVFIITFAIFGVVAHVRIL